MADRSVETSPQIYARIGGVLYLIIIVLGIFGEALVRNRLIVWGDATATAANIMSMESLWRLGIASEFLALTCAIALAMIYFVLLRPVSKELNLKIPAFCRNELLSDGNKRLKTVNPVPLFNSPPSENRTPLKAFLKSETGCDESSPMMQDTIF